MFKIAILPLFLSFFQSSLCLTITVMRNKASTGGDEVENKGCNRGVCSKYGLFCEQPECCTCSCPYVEPNYLVSKGGCKSYRELQQELNADCKYSFAPPNKPLPDLPLSQAINGSKNFIKSHSDPSLLEVFCNNTITANQWYYLDAFGTWKDGEPKDFFRVLYHAIGIGHPKNDYELDGIEWSKRLEPKYAGVLIKISLKCDSKYIGCALAKVMGSKTYTTNRPTTTTQAPSPTAKPEPILVSSLPTEKNESKVYQNVADNNKNKPKSSTETNDALAPVLAVVGALILALGIAAFIFYRRRQKRRDPETGAFANPDYNEPVYAVVNREGFENPVYSDPAAIEAGNRRSILGPLPRIPGTESTYQPLDNKTRSRKDNDGTDYDNPINDTPPSADYDNPPINTNQNEKSSDYDNPPVQGAQGNSSDYDNPHPVEDGDDEKNDYQVPESEIKEDEDQENTAF